MTLQEMVDIVVQEVPEAPLMTIRDRLRWAARELCTRADVWVQTGEPVVVAADTDQPVVVASRGEPLRIISLRIDGRDVTQSDNWFTQTSPKTVTFHRKPKENVLDGRLACRPHPGEMPPDDVNDAWGDTMTDGAIWRLLMMPQPWRQPELAEYYQRKFLHGVNIAKQRSRLGHGRGGVRAKPRRFL